MDQLQRNSARKLPWTYDASDVFAYLRPQLSHGPTWQPGQGRYLSITESKGADVTTGTVFETPDGVRFTIAAYATRAEANVHSPRAHLLAVRPEWSFPSRQWIDSDPQFWSVQRPSRVLVRPEWSYPSRQWIDADPQFWSVQRPSRVLVRPAAR